jgi:hypothetical protein
LTRATGDEKAADLKTAELVRSGRCYTLSIWARVSAAVGQIVAGLGDDAGGSIIRADTEFRTRS